MGDAARGRAHERSAAGPSVHGVLVIDKPQGPTSHDVVARARRLLREKRIGHAGTLDPMATGVLVVLVGEGTKLAPFLTAEDKRYTARVALGAGTDTLDAEGKVIATADVPEALLAEVRALAADPSSVPEGLVAAALREEAGRTEQVPPAFSAIQIGGERSHELARAGKEVELAPRPVAVRACRLVAASAGDPPSLDLDVLVSKGYYVRSLARDLGERLGVPAHLAALRRVQSGAFTLDAAIALDAGEAALRAAVVPVAVAAARALPVGRLTEAGAVRARRGHRLQRADFEAGAAPPSGATAAWIDPAGDLVAIGETRAGAERTGGDGVAEDAFVVVRGFVPGSSSST